MILNPPYAFRGHDVSVGPIGDHGISPSTSGTTTLVPLGGCGEFGRNMTALVCRGELYLIDCGILFSREPHLGLSGVFFDIEPWVTRFGPPKAYIITHAHRDHIGALMYCLQLWPAPVYATPWTVALLEGDFNRIGKDEFRSLVRNVDEGERFTVGCVTFEYIPVNHSIPESCSLYIQTPDHHIAHSGDFKIDPQGSLERPADLRRWEQIVKKNPMDLFLCDSTNAHRKGPSLSEETTLESLSELFGELKGRVFISTFSSNLWRLIHIIEAASRNGRKVHVLGFGMSKTLELAQSLGMYSPPEALQAGSSVVSSGSGGGGGRSRRRGAGRLTPEELAQSYERGDVFLVSGSQMEPRSVLARIVNGQYGGLKIAEGDTVIFSSRTIPGHEPALVRAQGAIMWQGGKVITTDLDRRIHVSGHAFNTDIEIMLSVLRPHYFVPIHGELSHLMHNALSRKDQKTFLWRNEHGCILHKQDIYPYSLDESLREVFVDQTDTLVDDRMVEERRELARSGVIVVSGVYRKGRAKFTQGPVIETYGSLWDEEWLHSEGILELLSDWMARECRNSGGKSRHRDGGGGPVGINENMATRLGQYLSQSLRTRVPAVKVMSHITLL